MGDKFPSLSFFVFHPTGMKLSVVVLHSKGIILAKSQADWKKLLNFRYGTVTNRKWERYVHKQQVE